MKITAAVIKQFNRDKIDMGLKAALDTFIASIADDIDGHFRYSQRDFERDSEEHSDTVALGNLQWQIASKLLKEVGVKGIKTTYFRNK